VEATVSVVDFMGDCCSRRPISQPSEEMNRSLTGRKAVTKASTSSFGGACAAGVLVQDEVRGDDHAEGAQPVEGDGEGEGVSAGVEARESRLSAHVETRECGYISPRLFTSSSRAESQECHADRVVSPNRSRGLRAMVCVSEDGMRRRRRKMWAVSGCKKV
jgi:hypothetical protein